MLHVLRSVLQTLEVLGFPSDIAIRMELSPTIGNSCFLPRLNLGFSVCFGFAFGTWLSYMANLILTVETINIHLAKLRASV